MRCADVGSVVERKTMGIDALCEFCCDLLCYGDTLQCDVWTPI